MPHKAKSLPKAQPNMRDDNQRERILVVDDDHAFQRMLEMTLGKRYEVICFSSGDDINDLIDSYDPQLIILDVNLPGQSGFDVCEKIRNEGHGRNIPILFLSASKDNSSFLKGLDVAGDAFLTKPCEIQELMQRIRYLIDRYERLL